MEKMVFIVSSMVLFFPLVTSQIIPSSYITIDAQTVSMSGSSATGHCSNVTSTEVMTSICTDPTSSVLFDGVIPTLTGLDGDMWASQLLTFQTTGTRATVLFDFTGTPGYVGLSGRLEVVMFNCPGKGISASTILVSTSSSPSVNPTLLMVVNVGITSCDSLVRVCTPITTVQPSISLDFVIGVTSDMVYLAEVTFFAASSASTCQPDTIITTAPPDTIITTAPPDTIITTGPPDDSGEPTSDITDTTNTTDTTTTNFNSFASTIITTRPTAETGGSTGTVAAVVVVVVLVIIAIVIIILILIIFLFKRKQRKFVPHTIEPNEMEMKEKDDTIKKTSNSGFSGGGAVYEDLDAEPTNKAPVGNGKVFVGGGTYEVLDADPVGKDAGFGTYEDVESTRRNRYEKTGEEAIGDQGDVYNVLREEEGQGRRLTLDAATQQTYGKLDDQPPQPPRPRGGTSAANNPMYTDVKATQPRRATSPPDVYATVNKPTGPSKPVRRPPKPPQPYAAPDAEYAVVDKKPSPNIPSKSPALQQYLETSPITSSTTTATAATGQEGQSKIATLSHSIVSNSALNDNPEYAPIGESNPVYSTADNPVYANPDHEIEAGMENVYAEPGLPAAMQEPNPSDNIYERIYSEDSLSPSSFNEGSRPSRTDNPEDLYHYSPIYSVPVVAETEVVQPLEVTSQNIEEVRDLGTGNFGAVLLAKTVGLSHGDLHIGNSTDTSVSVLVAVKKLKANANVGARNLFDKECKFMSRLNDPNVVRLLCVCKSGPVPFLVMEYMEHGDLNQYLQKHDKVVHGEGGSSAGEGEITQQKLIAICTQIASGMKYLATNNFVHRDLATRNCLVNEDYDVKIADFGMSRNLYDSHYYVIKGQAVLPIRWMASECFYGQFSAKTDVWAFGATMWEVFELAKHEPYYEMLDREVVKDACKKENRTILSRPAECPEEVYQIMLRCWPHLASERATFEELEKSLLFLN